jgi:pyridoxal phosphate enzyme (YggS family)
MIDLKNYEKIIGELKDYNAKLIAVSKLQSVEDIVLLKEKGQKAFGENYVQELVDKKEKITDVEWHFIGHLQTNKVKQIIPFTHLIHGIDSLKLFQEVNKQASKINRIQDCLLQIHIAQEETKFGLSFEEAEEILNSEEIKSLKNVSIKGLMGMASLTDDQKLIRYEFKTLRTLFEKHKSKEFSVLSMGMTSDFKIALEEGSTMVRIGSAIFGERKTSTGIM